MKFILCCVLLCIFAEVHGLDKITCSTCVKAKKDSCTKTATCENENTHCLAIHWAATQTGTTSDSYTMRCATGDECSTSGLAAICPDKDKCEAKCCAISKCDPFEKPRDFVHTADRSFRCYQCTADNLKSCMTEQRCDDDQNACVSLLLQGGNEDKAYTKRCARKDECVQSELDRLCGYETDQSRRKTCISSCCFDELCNEASMKRVSLVFLATLVAFCLVIFS